MRESGVGSFVANKAGQFMPDLMRARIRWLAYGELPAVVLLITAFPFSFAEDQSRRIRLPIAPLAGASRQCQGEADDEKGADHSYSK